MSQEQIAICVFISVALLFALTAFSAFSAGDDE